MTVSQVQYVAGGFDISSLSLTLWLRAGATFNQSAGTWTGTPSAGSSGSVSCTSSVHPSNGDTIAGATPPKTVSGSGAFFTVASSNLGTYIGASASSGWALFNGVDSAAGAGVLFDTGTKYGLQIETSAGEVQIVVNDGTSKTVTTAVPGIQASPNGFKLPYQLAQWYHDGTNLFMRLNSGAWDSVAAGAVASLAGTLRIGIGSASILDGDLVDIGLTNSVLTRDQFDDIRDALRATWKVSL